MCCCSLLNRPWYPNTGMLRVSAIRLQLLPPREVLRRVHRLSAVQCTITVHNFSTASSPSSASTTDPAAAASSSSFASSSSSVSSAERQRKEPLHIPPLQRGEYRSRCADSDRQAKIAAILRVDHAGEYGAARIYDGQLFVLRDPNTRKLVEEMRDAEREHLQNCEALIPQLRVRPTALLPFWNVAGFLLGAGSALLGPRAAMACTVAVEEVITEHYNDQLRTLHEIGVKTKEEEALKLMIKKNRDDEQEHHDIGRKHGAEQAPLYGALSTVIKAGCRVAIEVAKRV